MGREEEEHYETYMYIKLMHLYEVVCVCMDRGSLYRAICM